MILVQLFGETKFWCFQAEAAPSIHILYIQEIKIQITKHIQLKKTFIKLKYGAIDWDKSFFLQIF